MKLFRKLMAGAMAIAMLSAYTVAFATGTVSGSTTSGDSTTVSGVGSYAGRAEAVFLVKLPTTSAAAQALAFTVDPEESIESSAPANAIPAASGGSTYGTVIFSTVSGNGAQNTIYKSESAPMRVVNMSSVDVTVNMFASVSETKMTLSATSGFTATSTEHLFLAVKVATVSGGTATDKATKVIDAMGAIDDTELKCATGNYKSVISGGVKTSLVSGANTASENMTKAGLLPEDSWNAAQYTVIGAANGVGEADWQIDGLNAPNLSITWKIDPSTVTTYAIDPPAANNNYKSLLDKKAYKAGEIVTLYIKPTSDEAKLSNATLNYISVNAEGKMQTEATKKADVVATPTNGVYKAYFTLPDNLARPKSPKGDVTAYKAPTWEIDVG